MPLQIRKLNEDDAAKAFPRHGQMDLSEYVEAVGDLQPGDTAAMDLGDLTTRAAKRRLGQAATQLGRRLRWARGNRYGRRLLPGAGGRSAAQSGVRRP